MIRRVHREEWGTADDLLVPMQLTHSGRYSVPRRIIAYHNPYIDAKTGTAAGLSRASPTTNSSGSKTITWKPRGWRSRRAFSAVDVKATHGYLLSELLGAKTREGRYGGSLENRMRFIRNVIGKIRAAFGDRLMLSHAAGLLRRRALLARSGDRPRACRAIRGPLSLRLRRQPGEPAASRT